jgi:subtilase family serine protease
MASGGMAELTFTVANLGTVTSRVTDMTFFLSKINPQSPEDITILGSAEVPSLGQNGAFSGLYKVNIPENLAEGPYYLGGFIDLSKRVSETDDSNNIGMYPVKIRVYNEQNLPDIAAIEVSAPSEARAGGTIVINDTVQNVGFAQSGTFYVGFGLLPDTSEELTFLGMREVASIDPGTSSLGRTTLTVPSDTKPGEYTLMMVVYTPDGSDPNEDNDYMLAENKINIKEKGKGGKIDLVISTVAGPASASPGGTAALTATVRNQGSGTSPGFVVGYYLSNNTTVSQKDTLIGSFYVPALAPGISTSGSGPVTLPSLLIPGDYTLGAIADPADEIDESREDNNHLTSQKKVSISSADAPKTPVVTATTTKTMKPATTVKAIMTTWTTKPRTTLPVVKTSIKNRSL